jgi:hypothetical protein
MNHEMEDIQSASAIVHGFEKVALAWRDLNAFFAKTAQIPGDPDSFVVRYGKFEDDSNVADFIDGCTAVNECARELGSLAPPAGIFGEIFRLALDVERTAAAYARTLADLGGGLDGGGSADSADSLKQALTGSAGLVPMLVDIKATTIDLGTRIGHVKEQLQIANYAIGRTGLLNQANQTIGYLEHRLERKNAPDMAAESARKRQFLSDVDNIFAAGTAAVLGLASVENHVGKIGKVAADARSLLMSVCTAANHEQLTDSGWVAKALGMPEALLFWTQLNRAAQEFCARR